VLQVAKRVIDDVALKKLTHLIDNKRHIWPSEGEILQGSHDAAIEGGICEGFTVKT